MISWFNTVSCLSNSRINVETDFAIKFNLGQIEQESRSQLYSSFEKLDNLPMWGRGHLPCLSWIPSCLYHFLYSQKLYKGRLSLPCRHWYWITSILCSTSMLISRALSYCCWAESIAAQITPSMMIEVFLHLMVLNKTDICISVVALAVCWELLLIFHLLTGEANSNTNET